MCARVMLMRLGCVRKEGAANLTAVCAGTGLQWDCVGVCGYSRKEVAELLGDAAKREGQ